MCGVAGFVVADPCLDGRDRLRTMSAAIAHRGPHDEGYALITRGQAPVVAVGATTPAPLRRDGVDLAAVPVRPHHVGLAHRRFAVIAPGPEGHQPFWSEDGRTCLLFNGEIYNYRELRDELGAATFRTGTDTEVLLRAYLAWGARAFERAVGMWALALWDARRDVVLLCRDRLGERPLYWTRAPGAIAFASEISALRTGPGRADEVMAARFLHWARADVDERTAFAGISMFPAAHHCEIDARLRVVLSRYWSAPSPPRRSSVRVADAAAEVRAGLSEAVALGMRADVPLVLALSGGLDSSSVLASASHHLPPERLTAYTVRFRDREYDEWRWARSVLARYPARALIVRPKDDWTLAALPAFVDAMEEPVHAPDLVPDFVVRHALAARGFRVLLSGLGGDELFSGYAFHRALRIGELRRSGRNREAVAEWLLSSDRARLSDLFRELRAQRWPERPDPLPDYLAPPPPEEPAPSSLAERIQLDVESQLLPYWLRVGDKSSMRAPIEVRFPFLDHRLVELALRLPVELLVRHGYLKWILRKAFSSWLPLDVTWRRKKVGFPFPIRRWLHDKGAAMREVFARMDNPFLRAAPLLKRYDAHVEREPWRLFRALSFELWHRRFVRGQEHPASLRAHGTVEELAAGAFEDA